MAIRLESASNYLLYVRFANDACASLTTMTMTDLIELAVELQVLFDALSQNAKRIVALKLARSLTFILRPTQMAKA